MDRELFRKTVRGILEKQVEIVKERDQSEHDTLRDIVRANFDLIEKCVKEYGWTYKKIAQEVFCEAMLSDPISMRGNTLSRYMAVERKARSGNRVVKFSDRKPESRQTSPRPSLLAVGYEAGGSRELRSREYIDSQGRIQEES